MTVDTARAALHEAIRAACDAGETQRTVADAAGLSQAEVWRIVHPDRRDTRKR